MHHKDKGLPVLRGIALILSFFLTTSGFAVENWEFSGFATLGTSKHNRDGLKFGKTEDQWGLNTDSKIGLQLQGDIIEHLSFTTQVSASGLNFYGKDQYEPELQWLFLSYQFAPEVRARLGRMRTAGYLYSETRDVGYSYPWARPPIDVYVYLLQPLRNFDGADMNYTFDIGDDFVLDTHLFFGKLEGEIFNSDIDVNKMYGANLTFRTEGLQLRYSLHVENSDITVPAYQPLIDFYDPLIPLDPVFSDIQRSLYAEDDDFYYHSVGLQWEFTTWAIISEAYKVDGPKDSFNIQTKGWYVSLLYYVDTFTPYVVLSGYDSKFNENQMSTLEQASQQYGFIPEVTELLDFTADSFEAFSTKERSYTLGMRYDFMPSADIKFEIQYIDFLNGSTGQGLMTNGTPPPDSATLYTITLDVVF